MVSRRGLMQAKDIPDQRFLSAVAQINYVEDRWAYWVELADHFDWPSRVVLAKAKKLIKRGLMDGCECGCRGDFEVLPYVREGPNYPLGFRIPEIDPFDSKWFKPAETQGLKERPLSNHASGTAIDLPARPDRDESYSISRATFAKYFNRIVESGNQRNPQNLIVMSNADDINFNYRPIRGVESKGSVVDEWLREIPPYVEGFNLSHQTRLPVYKMVNFLSIDPDQEPEPYNHPSSPISWTLHKTEEELDSSLAKTFWERANEVIRNRFGSKSRPDSKTLSEEFESLRRSMSKHGVAQARRMRHVEEHLDAGDVVCRCYERTPYEDR